MWSISIKFSCQGQRTILSLQPFKNYCLIVFNILQYLNIFWLQVGQLNTQSKTQVHISLGCAKNVALMLWLLESLIHWLVADILNISALGHFHFRKYHPYWLKVFLFDITSLPFHFFPYSIHPSIHAKWFKSDHWSKEIIHLFMQCLLWGPIVQPKSRDLAHYIWMTVNQARMVLRL